MIAPLDSQQRLSIARCVLTAAGLNFMFFQDFMGAVTMSLRVWTGCVVASVLVAGCGGSGGGDQNSTLQERIESGPRGYTAEEFKALHVEYNASLYQGNTNPATIDTALVQRASSLILEEPYQLPSLPEEFWLEMSEFMSTAGRSRIELDIECEEGGTVTASGLKDRDGVGQFTISWHQCAVYTDQEYFDGTGSAIVYDNDELYQYIGFFNRVAIHSEFNASTPIEVTGYFEFVDNYEQNYAFDYSWNLVYRSVPENTFDHRIVTDRYTTDGRTINGSIAFSDAGRVDISTVEPLGSESFSSWYPGQLLIQGANQNVILDFVDYDFFRYLVDSDRDLTPDSGAAFSSLDTFVNTPPQNIALQQIDDIDDLSYPPSPSAPYINDWYDIYVNDAIVATPGSIFDRDTPQDQLVISYIWRINDSLVEGINGNTLPAGNAVADDRVSVAMVVSDGQNTTTSDYFTLTIRNSPAELVISDLPASVTSGAEASFRAELIDPDLLPSGVGPATLLSGPPGAVIDDEGVVRWTPQSDNALFSVVSQRFVFRTENAYEAEREVVIPINNLTASMPIARSAAYYSSEFFPLIIDDFSPTEGLEILGADSNGLAYLLRHVDGEYVQHWMYPYTPPAGGGRFVQLAAANIDDDTQAEIYVATESGISIIRDLDRPAEVLWSSTTRMIDTFAVSDTNGDGIPEVAILASSGFFREQELLVFSQNNVDDPLLTMSLSERSSSIMFGNVDTDESMELVLSQGLVFDTGTWSNQWYYGAAFTDQSLRLGDINNDGVSEIIGLLGGQYSGDNSIAIFSAASRSRLAIIEDANSSSFGLANIDGEPGDEIVSSRRYPREIVAYKWGGSAASVLWTKSISDYYEAKGLVVGDSNNDGNDEIHWFDTRPVFYVMDTNPESESVYRGLRGNYSTQMNTAGWTTLTPGEERAAFVPQIFGHDNSYKMLALIDTDGNMEVTTIEEDLNSSGAFVATVNDFDGDGYGDVYFGDTGGFGSFTALQLSDRSVHWSVDINNYNGITLVDNFDFDDDGSVDALYASGTIVNVVSIANQTLITSFNTGTNSPPQDIAIFRMESETSPIVVSANSEKLELWKKVGSNYVSAGTLDTNCSRINVANVDEDEDLELVCLTSSYWYEDFSTFVVYEFANDSFVEIHRQPVRGHVTDFTVDTSTQSRQSLLIAVERSSLTDYYDRNSQIEKFNPLDGNLAWSSAAFPGQVTHRSLRYRDVDPESNRHRLMFATNYAMYLVR